MSGHYSIGSQLDSECVKLTYCQTTGCAQEPEFNEADKNFISLGSNVTLNETNNIWYHHENMF